MLRFQAQVYRINDVSGWHDRRELTLAPAFQRRRVWSPRGRSFLIDSILRGMPLPQFFLREMVLPREKRTIREVVDGQQRLATILSYLAGDFGVQALHNDEFAGLRFDQLPETIQRDFLSFPLSVNVLQDTEERDVLEIFARLNSYTVPLNQQEKLNAQFVGAFKKTIGELAGDHLQFWKRHRILTDQTIARMRDLEFTSELVGAMLLGLQNQKRVVPHLYKDFEGDFPQSVFIRPRFAEMLQLTEDLLGGELSATVFSRTSVYYSLFCAVYEKSYGLRSDMHAVRRNPSPPGMTRARQALIDLSEQMEGANREDEAVEFYESTRQSTDKLPNRQVRHERLLELLAPAFPRN